MKYIKFLYKRASIFSKVINRSLHHKTSVASICMCLLLILGVNLHVGAQDENFLDDNFNEETNDTVNDEEPASEDDFTPETADKELDIVVPQPQAYKLLKFSIKDSQYFETQRSDTAQNKGKYVHHSNWKNELLINNYAEYKSANKLINLRADYNLYANVKSHKDKEISFDTESWGAMDSFARYELKEANIALQFLQSRLIFRVGKIYREYGSGYLVNPSNPLQRSYGEDLMFAKNHTVDNFSLDDNVASDGIRNFVQEQGSTENIGFWASEAEVAFYPLTLRLAYLPQLKSGFEEFDRPQHSFLSSVQLNAWDSITPMLLVFSYGSKWFVGADLSLGINDDITLHGEGGLSFENELLVLKKKEETKYLLPTRQYETYQNYKLEQYDYDGVYPKVLLGATYTPTINAQPFLSILFEVYYNGKGLDYDEWDTQISYLKDIRTNYDEANDSAFFSSLSDSYKGMAGVYNAWYSPLEMRPLYSMLRVYRDDVLMRLWAEKLNLAVSLVYSVFDTSFYLSTHSEVELKEMFALGVDSTYSFGQPYGVFTELTDIASITFYSRLSF